MKNSIILNIVIFVLFLIILFNKTFFNNSIVSNIFLSFIILSFSVININLGLLTCILIIFTKHYYNKNGIILEGARGRGNCPCGLISQQAHQHFGHAGQLLSLVLAHKRIGGCLQLPHNLSTTNENAHK
jgi:magnesium-transporting ATPase (P-type)